MRRNIIIGFCILLLLISSVLATDYFISNSGDDSLAGTSEGTAWKTLSKAASTSMSYGSTISLQRGSTWREAFSFNRANGMTIKDYGDTSLPKPKIYGSYNMSDTANWTLYTGSIYMSANNSFMVNPNAFWYNTTSSNSSYGRYNSTCILSQNWDWCYNTTNKSVMVYMSLGNPATYGLGIELPFNDTDYLVTNNAKHNVTWKNIEISYCRQQCFLAYRGNNTLVTNIDFKYSYAKPLFFDGAPDFSIIGNNATNNYFWNNGLQGRTTGGENIWLYRTKNFLVENNIIVNSGGVPINTKINQNGIIQNNNISWCIPNNNAGIWTHGIYLDGSNDTIVRNNSVDHCVGGYSINCETAGSQSWNNTIVYNVEHDNYISLTLTNAGSGASCLFNNNVSQNTFVRTVYTGISGMNGMIFLQNYTNLTFKDNIIKDEHSSGGAGYLVQIKNYTNTGYLNSDYNLYYVTTYTPIFWFDQNLTFSLTQYQSVKGEGSKSNYTNPQFITSTDYTPTNMVACFMSTRGLFAGGLPCYYTNVSTPSVNITPSTANFDSILYGYCNSSVYIGGLNLSYNYLIYKNSVLYQSGVSNGEYLFNISKPEFDIGDSVYTLCQGNNSFGVSIWSTSNTVYINTTMVLPTSPMHSTSTLLEYPNMTLANMNLILGDYNRKFDGIIDFWFVVLIVLGIIIMNSTMNMGFPASTAFTTFVVTLIALPVMALGLITPTSFFIFAGLFIISLFMLFIQ